MYVCMYIRIYIYIYVYTYTHAIMIIIILLLIMIIQPRSLMISTHVSRGVFSRRPDLSRAGPALLYDICYSYKDNDNHNDNSNNNNTTNKVPERSAKDYIAI